MTRVDGRWMWDMPIFVPISLEGHIYPYVPDPPSSPMQCVACGRTQELDTARIWNKGKCYTCAGALTTVDPADAS